MSLTTIRFTDSRGAVMQIAGVARLHVESADTDKDLAVQDLEFYEPVRIFSGDKGARKWLVPYNVMSAARITGYENVAIATPSIPQTRFEPQWCTLTDIVEKGMPMRWMLQPGLLEHNREQYRGKPVSSSMPVVLVGVCDASGSETYGQFYGLDGKLHPDPLLKHDFPTSFQYFVSL